MIPAAWLLACGARAHETHERGTNAEPGPETSAEAAPTPAGVVEIDAEMLRDLRITTARAEARPGGEGVTGSARWA